MRKSEISNREDSASTLSTSCKEDPNHLRLRSLNSENAYTEILEYCFVPRYKCMRWQNSGRTVL